MRFFANAIFAAAAIGAAGLLAVAEPDATARATTGAPAVAPVRMAGGKVIDRLAAPAEKPGPAELVARIRQAHGLDAAAPDCARFAWPYAPAHCLTRADGAAARGAVRVIGERQTAR